MQTPIQLFTTTREDLFQVGRIMAAALNPQLLYSKDDPVIVAICGSVKCGKSILAEAFREIVFGQDNGHAYNRVAYETGERDGHPVDIDFLDSSYADGTTPAEDVFLAQRKNGGIDIMQNKETLDNTDIVLWVESYDPVVGKYDFRMTPALKKEFEAVKDKIAASGGDTSWVRYMEVSTGARLQQDKAISDALQNIRAIGKAPGV